MASVLLRYLEPWSVYLRVPAEYGSLPELRETAAMPEILQSFKNLL